MNTRPCRGTCSLRCQKSRQHLPSNPSPPKETVDRHLSTTRNAPPEYSLLRLIAEFHTKPVTGSQFKKPTSTHRNRHQRKLHKLLQSNHARFSCRSIQEKERDHPKRKEPQNIIGRRAETYHYASFSRRATAELMGGIRGLRRVSENEPDEIMEKSEVLLKNSSVA